MSSRVCCCKGSGWVVPSGLPVTDPRFGQAVRCVCLEEKLALMEMDKLHALDGLTTAERLRTFGSVEMSPQMAEAAEIVRAADHGIITVWGPWGLGKTVLAHCKVNQMRDRGQSSAYMTLTKLLDWLRESYDSRNVGDTFLGRWTQIIEADCLVLDEVDKVSMTKWVEEKWIELIGSRWRYGKEKFTLLVCNEDPRMKMDGYFRSRLADNSTDSMIIEVRGEDMRQVMPKELAK